MGDRCDLYLIAFEKDLPKIERYLGKAEFQEVLKSVSGRVVVGVTFEQVNCGAFEERTTLAQHGAVFTGHHGPGAEYGPCDFVGIQGVLHECASIEMGSRPAVPIHECTGEPEHRAWVAAKRFAKARCRAYHILGITGHAPACRRRPKCRRPA